MTQKTRPTGMLGFTIVWIGQVISLLGSGMTWFALTIWAWEITGQATALALVGFFSFGPTVLLSPIRHATTDRADFRAGGDAAFGAPGRSRVRAGDDGRGKSGSDGCHPRHLRRAGWHGVWRGHGAHVRHHGRAGDTGWLGGIRLPRRPERRRHLTGPRCHHWALSARNSGCGWI